MLQMLRFKDARGSFSSALAKASRETMMPCEYNVLLGNIVYY